MFRPCIIYDTYAKSLHTYTDVSHCNERLPANHDTYGNKNEYGFASKIANYVAQDFRYLKLSKSYSLVKILKNC